MASSTTVASSRLSVVVTVYHLDQYDVFFVTICIVSKCAARQPPQPFKRGGDRRWRVDFG